MKKVILIGDSIRMSYSERVGELLANKATVWSPSENCRFAKYTLWGIFDWIKEGAEGKPDVIHWNNGIWDCFKISEDILVFTPLDEYLRTMEQIYTEMKKTGAKILFATTTAVGNANPNIKNETIDSYNTAITEFMKSKGVPVNDLNSLIKANVDEYLQADLLHLNEKGVEAAAQQVASFIEQHL